MISPLDLAVYTAAGALVGAAAFTAAALYLTADKLHRRAVWKDHAGPVGKARTTAGYVYRNTAWDYLPIVAGRGAALGGTLVLVLTLLAVGVREVFVSG